MDDRNRKALGLAGVPFLILGITFGLRGDTAFLAFIPIGIALMVVAGSKREGDAPSDVRGNGDGNA
ncbi:MAG TPA: hypothetical protein VF655_07595 [Allosphingosinicella sp.]|jgi:hypothetical protein